MPESILVVDDDPDIARFVEVNLRSAGYEVSVAGDGEEALERAGEIRPDLVLLDVMMPRLDGFEVAQRLRKNPQTANTSIIMLTAKALSSDKVTGLQSGADDYIIKPFDPIELLARVKGTLRRAKEMRNLSPLTGLPGNIRIQEEIERQVREHRPFAVLYVDLDNFKTYNDKFGFVRGDRLIQGTARMIQDAVMANAQDGFVGHVGGDDFVAVVEPEMAEDVAKRVCERFDQDRSLYYEDEDLERGFVRMEDRKGVEQDIPLVSVSVGIATTSKRAFAHYGEAVAVATEMKQFAKRDGGSSYAVDRRAPLPVGTSIPARAIPGAPRSGASNQRCRILRAPSYTGRKPVSGAGCDSPPAVTVRDPSRATRGWTRCDPGTDRDSRDGREQAREPPRAVPRRLSTCVPLRENGGAWTGSGTCAGRWSSPREAGGGSHRILWSDASWSATGESSPRGGTKVPEPSTPKRWRCDSRANAQPAQPPS